MKTKHRQYRLFAAGITVYILFLISGKNAFNGAKAGLTLCLDTLIPTLLPSLIFSGMLTKIGIPENMKKIFAPFLRYGLKLPPSVAGIWFFGRIGGYPLSFITADFSVKEALTEKDAAGRAALLCFSPGLAFTLITVGEGMFGSIKIGFILLLSVLFPGFILARFGKKTVIRDAVKEDKHASVHFPEALTGSVQNALSSVFNIAAWVILSSTLTGMLKILPDNGIIRGLSYLTEVTGAVGLCAEQGQIIPAAFCLGFGGFCVFLQLLPVMNRLEVSPLVFLGYRFFNGILSAGIAKILLLLFPSVLPACAIGYQTVRPGHGSLFSSFLLIFFAAVFMSDTKSVLKKRQIMIE